MDIDWILVLGLDATEYFKAKIYEIMRGELAICASGSSTEEDQKAYTRLQSCLRVEVNFNGSSISASFGIDKEKLPKDFLEKYNGMIDGFEYNISKKNQIFLETAIEDKIDETRLAESIAPYLYQQINSKFGGGESA